MLAWHGFSGVVAAPVGWRRRRARQNLAFVGAVTGFWHILWIAGVGMLAGGLVALAVHSAGYLGLHRDQVPTAQGDRAPGDTGS
jgi:hypothetical protein